MDKYDSISVLVTSIIILGLVIGIILLIDWAQHSDFELVEIQREAEQNGTQEINN